MNRFPIECLHFADAQLTRQLGAVRLVIPIHPFQLSLDGYSENVETELYLSDLRIPIELSALASKTYEFPLNPNHGYIDGSVYFFAAHHPVDVDKIEFGHIQQGKLPVTIHSQWLVEYEMSGFENFPLTINTSIIIIK